ncbi:MAG: TIGR02328 family protein [Thermaerobacterales bacterium]
MRLWHEALLPRLPDAQLLGQHRECCALRGLAWARRHRTVDYVFTHPPSWLAAYHLRVMAEMKSRGFRPDTKWLDPAYRGLRAEPWDETDMAAVEAVQQRAVVYPEHNQVYLRQCLDNLGGKGIRLDLP